MPRRLTIVAFAPLCILGLGALAHAQAAANEPAEEPTEEVAAPPAQDVPMAAGEATSGATSALEFGGAFRGRWVSLPHWFFNSFTKANQAVSSYSLALEGFRRKHDPDNPNRIWEVSLGIGRQSMSAPDGNWLGKNKNAALDTDWVQFKNLVFWTFDLTFLQRQYFNQVFGIHYGAGMGLAIIQGKILRTSSDGCTEQNLGDPSKCHPKGVACTAAGCPEAGLAATEKNGGVGTDKAGSPRRFSEPSVPGAIPIINLVAGFDFRVAKGVEFRLEGGFYDAFFIGAAVAYSH